MDHYHSISCAFAASLGILSHLLYFIRSEHHQHTLQFLQISFYGFLTSSLVVARVAEIGYGKAMQLTSVVGGSYLAALWASMLVYRAFFHPLHEFPGSRLAKLSKFYQFFTGFGLDGFRRSTGMHQKYGDFVRTGPNELSIISPSAASSLLGPQSPCIRAPWYDYNVYQPLESLHSTRGVAQHEARRRVWDHAFSPKALRDYEGRIVDYTHELIEKISTMLGKPMNASAWFNYYSFDVMGDFAFAKSFDMMKTGKMHFAIHWLEDSMVLLGLFSPIAWAVPVGAITPILGANYRRFIRWCSDQVEERRRLTTQVPDITSWLLKTNPDRADVEATKWLHGDSRLIIVAGSDTVAIVLTHVFYYLAKDPSLVRRLRADLDPLVRSGEPFNVRKLQNAKHLNAVINEVLRLHPPTPSGTFRTTPPEGITVDGVHIPGGVNVTVPLYALQRSEKSFRRPNSFIPERWTSRPDLILDKNGFAPFSLGAYGCIGKELAKMELRTVIPLLLSRFDVGLAPGEEGRALLEGSKDAFTLRMGELRVIFEERKG